MKHTNRILCAVSGVLTLACLIVLGTVVLVTLRSAGTDGIGIIGGAGMPTVWLVIKATLSEHPFLYAGIPCFLIFVVTLVLCLRERVLQQKK